MSGFLSNGCPKASTSLIDLGGYGDATRMPGPANHLAPAQHRPAAHNSGLAELVWFLTDRRGMPDGSEALYGEALLRLANGYVYYGPPPHARDVAELPAAKTGFVTFGCFNNLA